ncbi:MAG TPA: hypothetical protein VFL59_02775 [Candidatus Nanopelagicales bacterium]|nr:hypothetical protein [Candidatus Nanopelagicales bacterium]
MNESDVKELFAAAVARPDVDRIDTDAVLRGGRRRRHRRTAAALGSVAVVLVIVASLVLAIRPRGTEPPVAPTPVDTAGRAAANWQFPEGMRPDANSTSLTVDVRWGACASGAAVVDPRPVVGYSATEVSLIVWGIPPEGTDFDCIGNPATRMVIPLREPLGDRFVVPGAPPVIGFPGPVGPDVQGDMYAGSRRGTTTVTGIVTLGRNACWYFSIPGDRRYGLLWPYDTGGTSRTVPGVSLPNGDVVTSGSRVTATGILDRDTTSARSLGVGPPCFDRDQPAVAILGPDAALVH